MLDKNTLIPVASVMLVSSNMNVFANEVEQIKSSENEYKKITYKTGKSNTKIGKVNSSRGLNVRSTPRVEDGNKLYVLANGTDVEIIDEKDDWYKIKVKNKKSGWVSSQYIDLNSKSSYVIANRVNFRSGPSTSYSVIGKLSNGDKVEVISTSNGWSKIKYNGKTGYVSSQYLSSSAAPESTTTTTKYVNTLSLNVRSGPSTSYSVIGKVSEGDKVEVISTSNGWSKIKYNGKTGYVSSQYLSSSAAPESTTTTTKYVNTLSLNVRSGPSTSYSVIGKVSEGDKVEVISTSNGWSKIKYNGKTGYVSSQYLSSSAAPESTTTTTKYVNTLSLNVRSGPSTSYSVIGKVSEGDKVEVISTSNGWSKIKYNGKTGYVSSQYLSSSVSDSSTSTSSSVSNVISLAKTLLGKPYVWGGQGPNAFDCSGLMTYIFKNGAGINLPRTSTEQSKYGVTVSKADLKPGDLIFSSTNGTGKVSHVGIYIGNGEMIHAPKPGDVVKISNINNSYWNNAYLWSKRVL